MVTRVVELVLAVVFTVVVISACAPANTYVGFDSTRWVNDGGGLYHYDVNGVRCFHINGGVDTLSCVKL